MVVALKLMVLLGGLTALAVGLAMLLFMERFMAFNDFVNKNFLVGMKYDQAAFGFDGWLFGKSYVMAIVLVIVGLGLMTQFVRYAPYWN